MSFPSTAKTVSMGIRSSLTVTSHWRRLVFEPVAGAKRTLYFKPRNGLGWNENSRMTLYILSLSTCQYLEKVSFIYFNWVKTINGSVETRTSSPLTRFSILPNPSAPGNGYRMPSLRWIEACWSLVTIETRSNRQAYLLKVLTLTFTTHAAVGRIIY